MSSSVESQIPDWIFTVCGVYLLVVGVVGVTINSLVCVLFVKCKKLLTDFNLLLLNLVVTEELVCLIGIPFTASSALLRDWDMSDTACSLAGFIMTTLGMVAMCNLASLSLWRFLIIKFPGKFDGWKVSKCLLVMSWAWALILSCPPLLGWGHYVREPGTNISCSPAWSSDSAEDRSYNLYLFSLGFFLPLALLLSTSAAALSAIKTAVHSIQSEDIKKTAIQRQRKIIILVLLLACSFILCWTPYAVLALTSVVGVSQSVSPLVTILPHQLAKSSVLWDSLILIVHNPMIRKEAEKFLFKSHGEDDEEAGHDSDIKKQKSAV